MSKFRTAVAEDGTMNPDSESSTVNGRESLQGIFAAQALSGKGR